jgi:nucleoside-diphosphate-sugar epimerase
VKVAVLGATGFIGEHVTRWLVEAGHAVFAVHRGQTPARIPGSQSLSVDRRDKVLLVSALAKAAPSVLVDLIAYTAADVTSLLEALPPSVDRLVVVSSGDVYWTYDAFRGRAPPGEVSHPLSESAPLREHLYPYRAQAIGPDDVRYGYEKILVEQTAQTGSPVPVTVLRLPMVYGPGDRQQRVARYLRQLTAAASGIRLNEREAHWRCTRGYVEDVAWAIALGSTEERAAGQVFNVGEPEALTELEWVKAIGEAAGWVGRVMTDSTEPPSLAAEWSVPLITETRWIRELLGYAEPVGRAEGLRRTVQAAGGHAPRAVNSPGHG